MAKPILLARCWLVRHYDTSLTVGCFGNGRMPHSMSVQVDNIPVDMTPSGIMFPKIMTWPADSPLWPRQCVCGYVYSTTDKQYMTYSQLYKGPDDQEFTLDDAPPGAMWRSFDGSKLHIKTLDGDLVLDWPSGGTSGVTFNEVLETPAGTKFRLVDGTLISL